MPVYLPQISTSGRFWLPLKSLDIFLVSKLWYLHACSEVYRSLKFRFGLAESFRVRFTEWIGPSNLGAIRRLTLEVPYCLITMPSRYLAKYLRLLCVQMPRLKEFVFTTTIRRNDQAYTQDGQIDTWTEKHRALLHASAWVMARHENLKSAIWDEEGTVVNGRLDDAKTALRQDWRPVVKLSVSMYAKPQNFLQVMETPEAIREFNNSRAPEEDEKVERPATVSMISSLDHQSLT